MPGDTHLPLGGLDYAKLLFYEYLSTLLYKCSKLKLNKYMELNETEAITGVPMPGSYFLYNSFSNTHPILSKIIEIENYKI